MYYCDMQRTLCFDDVLLVPQYSEIESRTQVDLSIFDIESLQPYKLSKNLPVLKSPIIASPMDTVVGVESAQVVHRHGGFSVLHRYQSIEQQLTSFAALNDCNVAVAIGATGDYMERAVALHEVGCQAFCVDVAHGHHINVKHAVNNLRNKLGDAVHLMGGNVATLEAFNDLADWGFNSIRVGVGGGSVCSTRIQTGHGIPTLQSVIDCAASDRNAFIIADGGVRNSGDAVKALAAGADFVMLGSVLAGHVESPGSTVVKDGTAFKKFRGMASKEAQEEWRGRVGGEEGVSLLVPLKGSLNDTLKSFHDGLRSGLSYSGATSIGALRGKAKFIMVTPNSVHENHPHAKFQI